MSRMVRPRNAQRMAAHIQMNQENGTHVMARPASQANDPMSGITPLNPTIVRARFSPSWRRWCSAAARSRRLSCFFFRRLRSGNAGPRLSRRVIRQDIRDGHDAVLRREALAVRVAREARDPGESGLALERADAAEVAGEHERRRIQRIEERLGREHEEPGRADVDRGTLPTEGDEGQVVLVGGGPGAEAERAKPRRPVLDRRATGGRDLLAVHDAQPARRRRAGDEPRDATGVRSRDHLRGDARAADEDLVALLHVDACRRHLVGRRVDTERQLAERIRPVRRDPAEPPGRAFDRHGRVIRADDGAVHRRPHGPRSGDRRDVEITLERAVDQSAVDGRRDGPRETPAGAREHGAARHVRADAHAGDAIDIFRLDPELASALDPDRRPEQRAARERVPCANGRPDRRTRGRAERQWMLDDPALVPPAHQAALAAARSSAANQRTSAGIRSAARDGRRSGRPRASTMMPRSPAAPCAFSELPVTATSASPRCAMLKNAPGTSGSSARSAPLTRSLLFRPGTTGTMNASGTSRRASSSVTRADGSPPPARIRAASAPSATRASSWSRCSVVGFGEARPSIATSAAWAPPVNSAAAPVPLVIGASRNGSAIPADAASATAWLTASCARAISSASALASAAIASGQRARLNTRSRSVGASMAQGIQRRTPSRPARTTAPAAAMPRPSGATCAALAVPSAPPPPSEADPPGPSTIRTSPPGA